MVRHLVNWKPVKWQDIRGADIEIETPSCIDLTYRGTLLSHILEMQKQQPISFEDAIFQAKQYVDFENKRMSRQFDMYFQSHPPMLSWKVDDETIEQEVATLKEQIRAFANDPWFEKKQTFALLCPNGICPKNP